MSYKLNSNVSYSVININLTTGLSTVESLCNDGKTMLKAYCGQNFTYLNRLTFWRCKNCLQKTGTSDTSQYINWLFPNVLYSTLHSIYNAKPFAIH